MADAIVSDASAFADKRLGWILSDLHSRSEQPENKQNSGLYVYQETFADSRSKWSVSFPPGKRLKPGGVFYCFIGGMPFSASARVWKGYGLQDEGFQVTLTAGWTWLAGTDVRGTYQLIDVADWDPEAGIRGTGEPATTEDTPGERLIYSMVEI